MVVTVDDEAGELSLQCALAVVCPGSERPPHVFQCGCAARGSQARVVQAVEQQLPRS